MALGNEGQQETISCQESQVLNPDTGVCTAVEIPLTELTPAGIVPPIPPTAAAIGGGAAAAATTLPSIPFPGIPTVEQPTAEQPIEEIP